MYQFFVRPEQIDGEQVAIVGTDVNHIRNVLRMSLGEQIRVCDGQGGELICQIAGIGPDQVTAQVVSGGEERTELPSRIYLYQGLPKADKMEFIIQKAVELGAHEVIPVITRRTIVRLGGKKEKAKVERWNKVAESAAKQSQRSRIPLVRAPLAFREALADSASAHLRLIPYELEHGMGRTAKALCGVRPGQDIAVFIGPEGGFEPEEARQAVEAGLCPISLGRRILRTETAGLAALSVLMFQLELMQLKLSAAEAVW